MKERKELSDVKKIKLSACASSPKSACEIPHLPPAAALFYPPPPLPQANFGHDAG
jgi:hypothetical protein